jgi:hypothetical protein
VTEQIAGPTPVKIRLEGSPAAIAAVYAALHGVLVSAEDMDRYVREPGVEQAYFDAVVAVNPVTAAQALAEHTDTVKDGASRPRRRRRGY